MSEENTYQKMPDGLWRRLMSRLYPGQPASVATFILVMGLLTLLIALVFLYENFVMLRQYQNSHFAWMVNEVNRQIIQLLITVFGALLFLKRHWLGWAVLTGQFLAMVLKYCLLFTGQTVDTLLNPDMSQYLDMGAVLEVEGLIMMGLVLIMSGVMHLKAVRNGFNISKSKIWLGPVLAMILIVIDLLLELFLQLNDPLL